MIAASNQVTSHYVGRFAPSPSGPLHFGSLVAALASYIDARHHRGRWLMRMEDLDPPREQAGASDLILRSLEAHQLLWDGEVLYQSQRLSAYEETLHALQIRDLIFPCYCTRKALAAIGGPYPGTCRPSRQNNADTKSNQSFALRLLTDGLPDAERHLSLSNQFQDLLLGAVECQNPLGDFIVKRKDGLFAYQLAVVADDIYQGITHVIRGVDLLDCTPAQIFLFNCLGAPPPQFGHIPLALNALQQKLSKQHGARALNDKDCRNNILAALQFLNHPPPAELADAEITDLLAWASQHWQRQNVPKHDKVIAL